MASVTMKALKEGSYDVAGGAKVLDYTGKEFSDTAVDPLYLRRCRASKNNPCCASSHEDIGFTSRETAAMARTNNKSLQRAVQRLSRSAGSEAERTGILIYGREKSCTGKLQL